jgi:superfamily II DNA or RNA helicase
MSNFNPEIPNQPVQHIHNPGVRGVTTGKTREDGTDLYIHVQIGINDKKWYPLDELELIVTTGDDIEDLLKNLRLGKKHDLARILTYHKIDSNLSNVFYSMQASRTDFYAHQFKPVYKFIESLDGRILIADEVGLGKTIEAGLIWLETKARRADARRLLVVCPPMLREKWKNELRIRFDTRAEIYDSQGIVELLEDFRREGQNYQCAAVCSLNSIRQDAVYSALEEFENTNLLFDLVVIDESHHLRNVSTKSHRTGKLLSDLTESMVMLSATPIQLKDEDLFRQLNILNPEEFDNYELVRERLIENEPIIRAQSLLRHHPPKISDALEQIKLLKNYSWFKQSELLNLVETQIEKLNIENHRELIEVGRRLEKLNLFSSAISRTRKREVQEKRVERQAQSLKVHFTDEEMTFYDDVTEAVQERIESLSGNPMAGFAVMMPQRMMASSIPAMVEYYHGRSEWDEEVFDALGFSGEDYEGQNKTSNLWLGLEQIIGNWDLKTPDSKFEVLAQALQNRFYNEPGVKIIVFSFFKKTLSYLRRRLVAQGFNPLLIHGDVPIQDRQQIIDSFREDPERQILLSSEVGSEGIDLQFCRIIVNYDLPWNPMKVEQRIGRIDRLGQKADKITILNLSVADTIEEKILERLYNRIGIFQRSLGDLEQILGDVTEKLHTELLSHRLTRQQEDERIEDTQRAVETKLQLEGELVEQSAVFLGASEYILQQIGQARDQGRWITPGDLSSFIQDFFEHNFRGTVISWDKPDKGFVSIRLINQARNQLETYCQLQNPRLSTVLINSAAESKVLIYDPQKAQYNQKNELLNHFHPFVKWIAETHRNDENAFFPTAAVDLRTSLIPAGTYLLGIQFWTFEGLQKKVQIEYALSALETGDIESISVAESFLQEVLQYGTNWEYAGQMVNRENLMSAWNNCLKELNKRYKQAFEEFRQESSELKLRRRQHLEGFSLRKQDQAAKAIETLRAKLYVTTDAERNKIESQIKGNKTKISNLKANLEKSLAGVEQKNLIQKDFKEIAAVVCRVKSN